MSRQTSRRGSSSGHQSTSDGAADNRLACPYFRAVLDKTALPKTCLRSSDNMAHLKEHLKKHHLCDCDATDARGRRVCVTLATHMAKSVYEEIKKDRRRSGGQDSTGNQWIRMFKKIFPSYRPVPAPFLPTVQQLESVARASPDWALEELAASYRSARLPLVNQGIEEARQFLEQFPYFVEALSRRGAGGDAGSDSREEVVEAVPEPQTNFSTPDAASPYSQSFTGGPADPAQGAGWSSEETSQWGQWVNDDSHSYSG